MNQIIDMQDIQIFKNYIQNIKKQLNNIDIQVTKLKTVIYEIEEDLMNQEDQYLEKMFLSMEK